jgi:hypothetical protein
MSAQMDDLPGVLIRNYREKVKLKDAEAYWKLTPQTRSK